MATRPPGVGRAMLARTVALALAGAASGCVSAAQPGAPSGHATSVHVEPDDPTMRTAGAPTCRVDPPQTLGVLAAEDTWFQATFGERGGLAVWNSRDGARVRSLSREGAPAGPARSLDLPPGAMPIDAVADAGGFDVVSRRLIGASGEPRAMQAFVQTTSLDGAPSVLGGQITVPYGPLAGLAADGAGRLAFVTTNGVVV